MIDPVVIGIDPGGVTGWSVIKIKKDCLVDYNVSILDSVVHWSYGEIIAGSILVKDQHVSNSVRVRRERMKKDGIHTLDTWPELVCVAELINLITQWPGCAVVVEDFILRKFNADRELLSPVRITAALEMELWRKRKRVFRVQSADSIGGISDERLRQWGFAGVKGKDERAAMKHALTFLRKCKDFKTGKNRRELAWPKIY